MSKQNKGDQTAEKKDRNSVTETIEKLLIEKDVLKEKIRNVYEKGLEKLVEESINQLIGQRWVFFTDEDIYYDNEVASVLPVFNRFDCLHISSSESIDKANKMVREHFKKYEWEVIDFDELTRALKMSSGYPCRSGSGRINWESGSSYYSILKFKNSLKYLDLDSRDESSLTSGAGNVIPIWRLNEKESSSVSAKKALELWINNGLIPKELKDNELYLEVLDICKHIKLNSLKFDLDELIKLYESNKVKLNFVMDTEELKKNLLESDYNRAEILKYAPKMIEDSNEGHWELWETKKKDPVEVELRIPLVARNPVASVVPGVVGIDFGTKSTVVVYQEGNDHTLPMRVGTGDISKSIKGSHYENPTMLEFINLETFMKTYESSEGRPKTRYEDLVTSHSAFNNMVESPNASEFNSFFGDLKKWAATKESKYKIVDKNGKVIELSPFLELESGVNPIEIYAYYLGLYINNMHNGIYMDYYLSFPVTYEMEIRNKIKESFCNGLRKSLPQALIENEEAMKLFNVNIGASEPAAYAIIALQEYGFDPEEEEKIFYGIFDFGGGTTDFDFGIWREANGTKERRFDYAIEHFGAGGDRYLGGENILELLAFEVFKENQDELRKSEIAFTLPPECQKFAGSETLLKKSREANLNTKVLMEKLRPFWEKHEGYETGYKDGIQLDLWSEKGEKKAAFKLFFTLENLEKIVSDRIEKGIINFFHSLRRAFYNSKLDLSQIEKVNIFLAGNSSKAKVLRELFDKHIKIETEKMKKEEIKIGEDGIYKIFPPLGVEESYQLLEEMGLDAKRDQIAAPTGKTGVAYGLIESRKGSKVKIEDHNIKEDEVVFKYYLGENKKKKFEVVVDREVEYNEWIDFIDAGERIFEVYYTSQPNASTNEMAITDNSIKRERLSIDVIDEDASVYLRKVSPTAIEYVVAYEDQIKHSEYMSEVTRVELG